MFNLFKKIAKNTTQEIMASYGGNKDFLEAVCAACALVANADGNIEDSEKTKAISVVNNHPTLSQMYQQKDIETCLETMFKRAKDASGRQMLARELDDIKGAENGAKMSDDVYLMALDIAGADGNVGDDEKAVLAKIAKRLGVDTSKFEF